MLANTGVKHATVADVLAIADGCIVGSSLKVDGNTWNAVDPDRAAEFMRLVRKARANERARAQDEQLGASGLRVLLTDLMLIPGLSGYEGRVRRYLAKQLADLGLKTSTDRLGNLIATLDGRRAAPSVMLFTHMDQLGFVVRKIEADGLIRIERLGGVPERALPSQAVLICVRRRAGPRRRHRQQEPPRDDA